MRARAPGTFAIVGCRKKRGESLISSEFKFMVPHWNQNGPVTPLINSLKEYSSCIVRVIHSSVPAF